MKTVKTAALEMANKAIFAIQTVQEHLIEACDDNLANLALDAAITEIEGVKQVLEFDFSKIDNLQARIAQRSIPTISETQMSEFFEWLELSGEWTCDCTVFDSFWERFKAAQNGE